MRRAAVVLMILATAPAHASHDWFGLDLCAVRKEVMPPELHPSVLPEPESEGARLLGRYCNQCHYAPGPGQHTAAEWPEVLKRMGLLMDVTARFGGLVRDVQVPAAAEEKQIAAYLFANALRPLPTDAAGRAPEAYRTLCGDCHAVPDPASHGPQDWPAVLARMETYRPVMRRAPAETAVAARVVAFLTGDRTVAADTTERTSARLDRPGVVERFGPVLALGPFFAVVLLGAWRWYAAHRSRA